MNVWLGSPNQKASHFFHSGDFWASIVVFLMAVPLCMGIAIASGVPPAAGLLTGIIQLGAATLHLGQWFRAVSPAVIHGMLAGIGVLIFASQFHVMLDDVPRGSGIANLLSIPQSIFENILHFGDGITQHHLAAWVGALTILTMILWNRYKFKRLASIPAPLVGVLSGSLLAALLGLNITLALSFWRAGKNGVENFIFEGKNSQG